MNPYQNLDERPYESLYLRLETVIDHPVEKIWPHAVNLSSWMTAHELTTLAGESGKVGHFQRVNPRGLGEHIPKPHHHLYGIVEIIPHKLIAFEVFPEKGGSYGKTRERMAFDSIHLTDIGGRTQIVYWLVDVHMGKGDKDFRAQRQRELDGARKMLEGLLENLRQLVDKAPAQ